jgi:hypothetical protein
MDSPEPRNGWPPPPLLQKDCCYHAAGEAEVVAEDVVCRSIVPRQGGYDTVEHGNHKSKSDMINYKILLRKHYIFIMIPLEGTGLLEEHIIYS